MSFTSTQASKDTSTPPAGSEAERENPKIPSELTCFIHGLSPVKKSKNVAYFDCQLQSQSGVRRAVCFSPEKRTIFEKYQEKKSPVKISKFRVNEKEDNAGDILIQKYTNVIKAEPSEDFQYIPLANPTVHTISSLACVKPGQLVSLKAKIAKLSSVKTIKTSVGPLRKQEAWLADQTSSIKFILWESETDSLQEGKSYELNNIRLKQSQGERYVNTAKDQKFQFEEVEEAENIVAFQDYQFSSEMVIRARATGVRNVAKYYACMCCLKKVELDDDMATCLSKTCATIQPLASCKTQWFMKLVVKSEDNPTGEICLSVFDPLTTKLFQLSPGKESAAIVDQRDLAKSIFRLGKLKITYNAVENKMIDCEDAE